MIIDAHAHPEWYGHDLPKFLANMEMYGIDLTWLLCWECPSDECDPNYLSTVSPLGTTTGPIPFDLCVSYAERAPGKFVLGYAPDPRRPGAIERLQSAIGLYGVRVYGELKLRMTFDNPDALRMYRFCGEKGLPILVHIDYELDTGRPFPRPSPGHRQKSLRLFFLPNRQNTGAWQPRLSRAYFCRAGVGDFSWVPHKSLIF